MKHFVYIILSAIILQSCSSGTKAEKWFSTDFENVSIFGRRSAALSISKSSSGLVSTFVDETNEYSYGGEFKIKDISKISPKECIIQAKLYSGAPSPDAMIVFEIKRPGEEKTLFWNGITLKDKVTAPGQWMDIEEKFTLVNGLLPDDEVKIYLWRNAAKAPVFMDDLGIGFNFK